MYLTGVLSIRCSTNQILRREFRVQNVIEPRLFLSSRAYGALESTTSQQNDQQGNDIFSIARVPI